MLCHAVFSRGTSPAVRAVPCSAHLSLAPVLTERSVVHTIGKTARLQVVGLSKNISSQIFFWVSVRISQVKYRDNPKLYTIQNYYTGSDIQRKYFPLTFKGK